MRFTLGQRKTVFEGRAFGVQVVQAHLPDGRSVWWEVVRHVGAVTIVPVDEQGRIWFVRQYRIGAEDELLELPAGTLELDEAPEACAAREVREEIGHSADKLEKLGEFYLAPGYSTELMQVYLATGLHPAPLPQDAFEFLDIVTLTRDEVFAMLHRGELRDAKSLAALLLAEPHLK